MAASEGNGHLWVESSLLGSRNRPITKVATEPAAVRRPRPLHHLYRARVSATHSRQSCDICRTGLGHRLALKG